MKIGIVGAGIMGRLLAWQLAKQGLHVSIFDRDNILQETGQGQAAAYTAAGMLTPYSEAESAELPITQMGRRSLILWPELIKQLNADVDFHQHGSLILAHASDRADLENFRDHAGRLQSVCTDSESINSVSINSTSIDNASAPKAKDKNEELTQQKALHQSRFEECNHTRIQNLEPEINQHFNQGIFIPGEAWLQPHLLLKNLAEQLQAMDVAFYNSTAIETINSSEIKTQDKTYSFDLVCDCRGLGAKIDIPQLRGVRGETLCLHAPDVHIKHLIRLMHPRYRLYIVPRKNQRYLIGATQLECDDDGPITVRSTLELLSAAYSVHSGFGEASVEYSRVNCRPALADNLPKIDFQNGVLRINGLFRHGFLLAPALAERALEKIAQTQIEQSSQEIA